MNKVQIYCSPRLDAIQNSVNEFANNHEIINISIASRTNFVGGGEFTAMVLYKCD